MKRILASVAMLLGVAAMASAAPLCTGVLGSDVLVGGFSCELGGLTFSNFSAVNAGGVPNPSVILVGAVDAGTVYLTFNPNLAPAPGTGNRDIHFYFQVTGGLLGVDLANAGSSGSSVFERVCASGVNPINNLCSGQQLAELSAFGSGTDEVFFQTPVQAIYIYKDILAPQGEHLSSFTQSFHVPEPVTFVLIGTGLLAFGLVRRRTSK